MSFASLARYADQTGRWSTIALGFSIPISVALDNMLLALVLAGWLLGAQYRAKLVCVRTHPPVLAALALFALLALGTAYGERYAGDGIGYLGKYADLVLFPVLIFVFQGAREREHALYALAASLALVLLLSYLVSFGVVPQHKPLLFDPANPVVFKYRLTHNILMAFATFLYANLAWSAPSARVRWGWGLLALLAAFNVTMMVEGRTGQVILGVLALYAGYAWKGWRGLSAATLVAAAFSVLLAALPGPVQERFNEGWKEFTEWRPGQASGGSSIGDRLDFYHVSLGIVGEHPLFGVGTGGFPKAYAEKTRGTPSRNPHNEFLLITVQLGLLGLAALLCLFYTQWRFAGALATPLEVHLARGLVLTMVTGCLFNSLLIDHTEGLLYVWLSAVLYGGLKSRVAR